MAFARLCPWIYDTHEWGRRGISMIKLQYIILKHYQTIMIVYIICLWSHKQCV